jgi:hypothetical protein
LDAIRKSGIDNRVAADPKPAAAAARELFTET